MEIAETRSNDLSEKNGEPSRGNIIVTTCTLVGS